MNSKIVVLIYFIFCLCSSCQKNDLEEVPIFLKGTAESGCATALKNNQAWSASAFIGRELNGKKYYLRANTYTIEGYERGILTIGGLHPVIGTQQIQSDESTMDAIGQFFTRADGGDVEEDAYLTDESKSNNQITITLFDTITMRVEGTFSVAFKYDDRYEEKENPNNPNKFELTEGEFAVDIIE